MMPTKYVQLPPNLVKDKKYAGKSIYSRDYCYRHRHGKRATTPSRSYTSLLRTQQKLVGDMHEMQLSDHFTTYPAALSMGYSRKDFENTLGNTKELDRLNLQYTLPDNVEFDVEDTDGAFLENAPDSLKKIEQAWLDEVDTTKRERGNVYGLAGKKMNLHPRKVNDKVDHKKTKSLPGLDKWLSTANEYEKQVVHNFVSRMSDAYRRPETPRPQSTPAGLYLSGNGLTKPKQGKSVRINSKLVSPRLSDLPATGLAPSPPKASPRGDSFIPSPRKTPPRCNESSQSCRSSQDGNVGHNVSTQLPYPSNEKPSSPLYEAERPASVPVGIDHSCQKCEACKKKVLKRIVDELAGAQTSSYEDLLKQKARNLKTISSQMYQPASQMYQPFEDYLHPGCSFQNVAPRRKGDFTIHPDFVSENIVDLKKLRRKHEKYFGESKIPVF